MRTREDALDQLEYEDVAIRRLLDAIADPDRDRAIHGRLVKLLVERMAVREAAREILGEALADVPGLADPSAPLREATSAHRQALDRLDDLTRGITPPNINQAQDVDAVVADIAPGLRREIADELRELIPTLARRMDARTRRREVPSAHFVLTHCPLHPGAHERRWYDRVRLFVWVHAVYDYLRSLPVGGVKPRRRLVIPDEGEVSLDPSLHSGSGVNADC